LRKSLEPTTSKKDKEVDSQKRAESRGLRLKDINWLHVVLLTGTPLATIYGLLYVEMVALTLWWAVIYYFITGLGITAGYHRLWSHRSFQASLPLRWALMLAGSGSMEGSIRWWCRDHRAHHQYTDSPLDPYSAQKGLFYSHLGWMLIKQQPSQIGKVDITDLEDPMVAWQHRNYMWIGPLTAFLFPSMVAGLFWGDWTGGLFFAGFCRLVFVHHSTFCVNSIAHYLGEASFDPVKTPRDHLITALLTLGEGYHNFHHRFPTDYRNGLKLHHYDPTKWLIAFMEKMGLASNLRRTPDTTIEAARRARH